MSLAASLTRLMSPSSQTVRGNARSAAIKSNSRFGGHGRLHGEPPRSFVLRLQRRGARGADRLQLFADLRLESGIDRLVQLVSDQAIRQALLIERDAALDIRGVLIPFAVT